ncbi:uncharacterized protein L201_004922 [Kwoniella dendrophila CBS 6074]|uniref:DNA binding protein Ncp1 n=1 Tax=Kwoniella dendrophila CBS 6074 TaxID=1295534 RepID=A0AAX4JXB6_9TREE
MYVSKQAIAYVLAVSYFLKLISGSLIFLILFSRYLGDWDIPSDIYLVDHKVKSPNTASEAIQLGLVGLLTRPVIQAVFPSGKEATAFNQSTDLTNNNAEQVEKPTLITSSESVSSPASTPLVSPQSTEPSSPKIPALLAANSVPALGGSIYQKTPQTTHIPAPVRQEIAPTYSFREPISTRSPEEQPQPQVQQEQFETQPLHQQEQPEQVAQKAPVPVVTENAFVPILYTQEGTHPINMAAVAPQQVDNNQHFGTNGISSYEDHDQSLAEKAQNLDLNDRPSSRATHRTNKTTQSQFRNDPNPEVPSEYNNYNQGEYVDEQRHVDDGGLGSHLSQDPTHLNQEVDEGVENQQRPGFNQRASRSYVKPIPIVTTYEPELPESASVRQRKSVAASTKAPSVKRASSKAASIRSNKAPSINGHDHVARPASRAASINNEHHLRPASRAASINDDQHVRPSSRAASVNGNYHVRSPSDGNEHHVRSPSVASVRRLPQLEERDQDHGFAPGQIAPSHRQHELQGGNNRVSLQDSGPISRDRSTTFEEPDHSPQRATSPNRPHSSFGYRPQPNLLAISEGDRAESRNDQTRDLRAGVLSRNGTTVSRAGTYGRNNNLSRGANGGTIGSRKGAFGRGAGASVGTQPEDVLGRDDIHQRAELSERILDDATLRKLSTMEKKDAKRLTKVIKLEGKSEAKAVAGSIKELERLTKLQREAAAAERKSQLRLSKWTRREHKARLRFLKEKEKYEKIEGELRNCENDFEERRDHASGLTAQVAEKTLEVDEARANKAADDREREVKILALKNPGHS